MKKICLFMAFVAMLSSVFIFSSCKKDYIEGDVFFSAELLKENHLENMPKTGKNARLYEGHTLYFKTSQSEYENYARDIVAFIRQKEDVVGCGYAYGSYLVAEITPGNSVTKIKDDYDYSSGKHTFVFSVDEKFENEKEIVNPCTLVLERHISEVGGLFDGFEYNTILYFMKRPATYKSCPFGHAYDKGTMYFIPGSTQTVTINRCKECGDEKYTEIITDNVFYNIDVKSGDEFLFEKQNGSISGLLVSIKVKNVTDKTFYVKANDCFIAVDETKNDYTVYSFIMPKNNVTLEICENI